MKDCDTCKWVGKTGDIICHSPNDDLYVKPDLDENGDYWCYEPESLIGVK